MIRINALRIIGIAAQLLDNEFEPSQKNLSEFLSELDRSRSEEELLYKVETYYFKFGWSQEKLNDFLSDLNQLEAELYKVVRDNFKGDPYAEQIFDYANKNPFSEECISHLRAVMEDKMRQNPPFKKRVKNIIYYLYTHAIPILYGNMNLEDPQRAKSVSGSDDANITPGRYQVMVIGKKACGAPASPTISYRGSETESRKAVAAPASYNGPQDKSKCSDISTSNAQLDDAAQPRYLNIFIAHKDGQTIVSSDLPLINRQHYRLCVKIDTERDGLGDDKQPFPDKALTHEIWKGRSSLPLTVMVSSRDFDIDPKVQTLELPRNGASQIIQFATIPKIGHGNGKIMLEVFYHGFILQSKSIDVLVVPSSEPEFVIHHPKPVQTAKTTFLTLDSLDHDTLSSLPERLLTIVVENDPKDGSRDFRLLDRTGGDKNVAFFDTRLQPDDIGKAISNIRNQIKVMVEGQSGKRGYMYSVDGNMGLLNTWLPRLANAGRSFYRALFSKGDGGPNNDQIKELKSALKAGTVIQVNPVMGVVTIPWGLLYEREIKYIPDKTKVCDKFLDCEEDCADCKILSDPYIVCPYAFWGYRYKIEQLPCWVSESPYVPSAMIKKIKNEVPISVNFNVWNKFDKWKDHLKRLDESARIDLHQAEKVHEVENIWKEKGTSIDVIYFYCHGGTDTDYGPYLELTDNKINSNFLEASNLQQPEFHWHHNPLVFLNGCATGDYGPGNYVSLIEDFIQGGACGVVGTECGVQEDFAEAYAAALFPKFFLGQPLGQAMHEVSLDFLRKKQNPMGLVYTLYAYNQISLAIPVSKAITSG